MKQMNQVEVLALIGSAIGKHSGEPSVAVTLETSMDNLPVWDSLAHLGILMDLDNAFDGRVAEISELAGANSVQRICDLLSKHSLLTVQ